MTLLLKISNKNIKAALQKVPFGAGLNNNLESDFVLTTNKSLNVKPSICSIKYIPIPYIKRYGRYLKWACKGQKDPVIPILGLSHSFIWTS